MHPADHISSGANPGTTRISGVVFDMGGVLTIDPYQACNAYAVELGLPQRTIADYLHRPQFAEVELGKSSVRDFFKFVCVDVENRFGAHVDIRRLAGAMAAGQQIRPEMIDLIGRLAERTVKLALLTNNAREARSWWTSGVLPLESFDAVIDSSEVGMRKPSPEIFVYTARQLSCETTELLFFDDTAANVAGATAARMVAELFTSPEQCRRVCVAHGLLDGGAS